MKSCFRLSRLQFLFEFAVTWLLLQCAGSAASITVTPSAVSNTYSGTLALNITGLTNHEPVAIQTYLDLNRNGSPDGGDLLVDAFEITESGVNTIGGITNINVPFDSNSATDAITATLSFAPPIESVVAQKIYRLVSPSGRFSPATCIFNITNAALAQSVNGTVFNGGVPVPNAIVVALRGENGGFASAVVADNAGHYALNLDPDTYLLLPVRSGYYTDQSLLPVVTLTNGATATNNLYMTNGTVAISGQVYDSATSNGLGGVFMQFESDNLFAVTFTDTSGNYSASVTPASNWKIKLEGSRLPRRAYVAPGDSLHVDTTGGNVANANLALPKANALFYGRIADGSNAPLANVDFFAGDNPQQFKADGFSDANGNYAVAVLAGAGEWNCSPDSGNTAALANYITSKGLDNTNIAVGQALLQNLTVLLANARISGHLRDHLGDSLSGIGISANAVIGGIPYNTFTDTDGSGNYSLPAATGVWSVFVNCCGDNGLENLGLVDFGPHTVSIPPTNSTLNLTVYPIGTPFLSQPSRFAPSSFGFSLTGAAGSNYIIQASTNLSSSTNWFTMLAISNLPGNFFFVQDNQATNGQRFYRARLGP